MIFVTIGTQLPFDRLIKIIDEMAPELKEDVVAQVYRIAALGEHRNEHQLATARKFKEMGIVNVAMDEEELTSMLLNGNQITHQHIGCGASPSLIQSIQKFIDE